MESYLKTEKLNTLLAEINEEAFSAGKKKDPFRILISTILSVRNRDEMTAIATKNLFDKGGYNTPKKLYNAPVEEVEILIRKSGTYRTKTRRIKETSRIIMEKYNNKVPNDLESLLSLPGVGRKVANCVLVYAYDIPVIPVDTHVHRISNRIGWVETKTPEKTEFALMKIFPKKYWLRINNSLVIFGKTLCKPISPNCLICPITESCLKKIIKPKKKKNSKKKMKKGVNVEKKKQKKSSRSNMKKSIKN
ncbi:MAG: endonuclease III [archaeon]|nr:endonuclease III [archaeon]